MTPQIQDNFNGGIWAGLESQVRTWAKNSDTLYVVTGCVTEGSTYYALDNNGKKVTVPTGYYKAVLRYSKSTTLGFSGYMACAVYLDHKEYSAGTVSSSYSMSIDDLEKKLGLDLFVNLPDAIGQANADKVEAQEPSTVSWWW
jgi:endonuclease G